MISVMSCHYERLCDASEALIRVGMVRCCSGASTTPDQPQTRAGRHGHLPVIARRVRHPAPTRLRLS
jgi:hypothetical protein